MIQAVRDVSVRRAGLLCVLVPLALVTNLPAADVPEQGGTKKLARQILKTTQVKGGLVVHLGCDDGRLTAALRADGRFLVQGLESDPQDVVRARRQLQASGVYGPVSIDCFSGDRLPYIENVVNLLVVEEPGGVTLDEMMRVLVPRGVAYVRDGETWTKHVKPWPTDIDQWTHWLHDASGNAVARDRVVGPPRRLQWVVGPRWSRHHNTTPSLNAAVSAGGRIFYGPFQ